MAERHEITVLVEGQLVSDWQSGNVESSILTPADSFVLRIPANRTAWRTLRRDARIIVRADGIALLDGFIEKRFGRGRDGVFEIHGRDRAGRLVDEAAPAIDYNGLQVIEAIRRLASPWFEPANVVLSNARNRRLRRGRGKRIASETEPVVTINVRVPRRGAVHPGEKRWQLIHEICERAGVICFSSADGKELIVCKANQTQAPRYQFILPPPGSGGNATVRDFTITEDDGDRYSMYLCAGVGGQGDTNYGKNVIDNRGVAFDNPFNKVDGTGRDFIHPKRMFLPERAFDDFHDAQRVAENEKNRRDFKRHSLSVECHLFGQAGDAGEFTYFAPDTVGHAVSEEYDIDDNYYIVSSSFSFARDNADRTTMHMVPVGTEIVL